MNHAFMKSLSEELATVGVATLRYNFLYMEQKKKRPDFPAVAHQAVAAAIDKARIDYFRTFHCLPVVNHLVVA
jgi:predicted alpha/beta-hydrolase family hydrolase